MKETKKFKTESKELLNLMINSIYTNKEIFLRELISNASDAIDKYKFLSLSNENQVPDRDHEIFITPNLEERTITISDTGIGMSHDDLVNNLGVIAKSGSKEFIQKFEEAKNNKDLSIIGQFGVGFYSAFMVADKVQVLTKTIDSPAYLFESDGLETYSITETEKDSVGTSIKIYLKSDTEEEKYSLFLEQYQIEELVKKYSDYIRYPIKMEVLVEEPYTDEENKDEPKEPKYEVKVLNSMIPLWKKNKSEVSDEDLNNFYKEKFHDYEDPLISMFVDVDGLISYKSLLFIPSHAPYNLYSQDYEKGLDLYSKGIFVKENCKELVPDFLKFTKGLVDSDDFSLNISRELLQNSPVLRKIENNIEKKVVDKLLDAKKNDTEKYNKFFDIYGNHLKYGIYSTFGQKKDLLKDLLIYNHLNAEDKIDLATYIANLKEDQKNIYYASGKTLESIKLLPQIESYKAKGIDVLLFNEEIDEFAIMMLGEYDGHEFKNISDEKAKELTEEEQNTLSSLVAENKRILDDIKEILGNKVDEVTFSTSLVDSPVCITTKDGLSLNMEKVLQDQPNANEEVKAVKVLEINPNHKLFKSIKNLESDDELVKKYGSLLYDEAMLLEGYDIEDKASFIRNLNDLMFKE